MVPDFSLIDLVFWHWWVICGVFLLLEIMTFGFFFLWLGVSAAIVGFVLVLIPDLIWQGQFILWAFLSVGTALFWRGYKSRNPDMIKSDEPFLNQRGKQYVDRTFTLEEPVVNSLGKIKVDDSTWKIECAEDLEAGQKVRVVGVEGTVLQVEKA